MLLEQIVELQLRGPLGLTCISITGYFHDETKRQNKPISGRVNRASATEAVDSGSIPGGVKPKTIKIGIHSFPA